MASPFPPLGGPPHAAPPPFPPPHAGPPPFGAAGGPPPHAGPSPFGPPHQAPQGSPTPARLSAALQPIIDLLQEDGQLDPQELVAIENFRTEVMKILADRQKSSDGMLQGKIDPRAMRRLGG